MPGARAAEGWIRLCLEGAEHLASRAACPRQDPSSKRAPAAPLLLAPHSGPPALPVLQQGNLPALLGRVPRPVLLHLPHQRLLQAVAALCGIQVCHLRRESSRRVSRSAHMLELSCPSAPHLLQGSQQPCPVGPACLHPRQPLQELMLAVGPQGQELNQALSSGPGAGCCWPMVLAPTDMTEGALLQQADRARLLRSRDTFAYRHTRREQCQHLAESYQVSSPITPSAAPVPPASSAHPTEVDRAGTWYCTRSATGASCYLVWPNTPRLAELLPLAMASSCHIPEAASPREGSPRLLGGQQGPCSHHTLVVCQPADVGAQCGLSLRGSRGSAPPAGPCSP